MPRPGDGRIWRLLGIVPALCLLFSPLAAAPRPGHVQAVAVPSLAEEALPKGWRACGSFRLDSADPADGGWSDLTTEPDGSGLWLVSDHGQILFLQSRWKAGQLTGLTPEVFTDLPYPPGHDNEGRFLVDAESLTLDGRQRLWVGFERLHRIEAYQGSRNTGYTRRMRCDLPSSIRPSDPNKGMESLIWDEPTQSLYAFLEKPGEGGESLIRFTPLPEGRCAVNVDSRRYPYTDGYEIASAVRQSADRWWVVERRFSVRRGFESQLVHFNPNNGKREPVAPLNALMADENVEGVALYRHAKGLTMLLVSDDNARLWQQSLLRAFCLPE